MAAERHENEGPTTEYADATDGLPELPAGRRPPRSSTISTCTRSASRRTSCGPRPIGSNGFYKRNGARADFDQQPIEAQTTVSACLEAYRATADPWWYEQAQRAFDWFLGWNDLGLELYAAQTGGCRDGLHADRSNENQGADLCSPSPASFAEMRLTQNTTNSVQRIGRQPMPSNEANRRRTQHRQILDPGPHHAPARPFSLMSDQRSIKIAARVMAFS